MSPKLHFRYDTFRPFFAGAVVIAFLLFVFTAGIVQEGGRKTLPSTLNRPALDSDKRIIAIGDIHGMNDSLSDLLAELSYNPGSDTLIHLGDLVTKGGSKSSPVLTFMSTNNILGVRGNNDQKVIEWRAWMDWILSIPGGKDWLEDVDKRWPHWHVDGDHPNTDYDAWPENARKNWDDYIPKGWKLLGTHYKVARDMSREHYDYLRSLPLVLYAPTGHTYFVHAGLLAADPTRKLTDPKQPLAHWPTKHKSKEDTAAFRRLQELALLNDVPQNQDPWVVMNMRSLTKNGKVMEGKKGTPWSDLWNDVMVRCSGLDAMEQPSMPERGFTSSPVRRSKQNSLPCFPSMVLYGHAAARGLDVKRWSVGIDTGCTYGRRLTALVLDKESFSSASYSEGVDSSLSPHTALIPYGDGGRARITSVQCSN
ncbi:Metallo-dependent phosphatase-like protein [Melanogaster broomeanus]|nr:Metallo-dependent phosphatase-like protein [Melanogaster broomeanus]